MAVSGHESPACYCGRPGTVRYSSRLVDLAFRRCAEHADPERHERLGWDIERLRTTPDSAVPDESGPADG